MFSVILNEVKNPSSSLFFQAAWSELSRGGLGGGGGRIKSPAPLVPGCEEPVDEGYGLGDGFVRGFGVQHNNNRAVTTAIYKSPTLKGRLGYPECNGVRAGPRLV